VQALPDELNQCLHLHFTRSRRYFSKLGSLSPEAVILGGGYGRGEGGVALDSEGTPCFYNDLDYFIFTDDPDSPALYAAVKTWEREESERLGIDVEGKCLPRSDLTATPHSMMFFDLVSAHTVVMGPKDYLEPYLPLASPSTIAPIEATRLLWNRGSGLLFAKFDLAAGDCMSRVHRNQAKAKLALGDALLTIRGKYRPYVRERQAVLRGEPDLDARIAALHATGTAFKLRPTTTPSFEELVATQTELVAIWMRCFLEVESSRLGHAFKNYIDYSEYSGRLFPATSGLRNCMLAMRDRLKRGGGLRPMLDYPRGALQRSLLCLLSEPTDFQRAEHFLGDSLPDLQTANQLYSKWWELYS
jgi:hypothetical protein